MNIANFNQLLNETISWCLLHEIIDAPVEDEGVVCRRSLNRRGAELFHKGFMMAAPYKNAGWFSRWRAKEKICRAAEMLAQGEELMKTAAISSIIPPLRQQLRSEGLRPVALSLAQSGVDHSAIVKQVTDARSKVLRNSCGYIESQSLDSRGGRLLLYAPENNLACGAAEYSSLGFFDIDNVPPWDTWMVMFGKYLVSWVPPQLIQLVQRGPDVNPEQCIMWADDPSISKEPIATALGELSAKVA